MNATIASAATLALAASSAAQATAPNPHGHTIEVLIREPQVLAVTGDVDMDPSCLTILPDDDIVFVDTEPGVDQVLHWDSTTEAISLVTDEATLGALSPFGATSIVAFESIVSAANNDLYLLVGDASGAAPFVSIYVVRISYTGAGNGYGGSAPTLAAVFFATESYVQQMVIDKVGNRLIFLRDSNNASFDASTAVGANGIYTLSLALPQPVFSPNLYTFVEPFLEQSQALTPAPIAGFHDMGPESIAFGHGAVFAAHSWTDEFKAPNFDGIAGELYDGDIVRTDLATGTSTRFIDRTKYIADTNRALALHRVPGENVYGLNLLLDEAREVLYVMEDIPHAFVTGYSLKGTNAAAESLVAYDSKSGEFLGVVVHNFTFRSLYPSLGINGFPDVPAGQTTLTLANFPLALGPDGSIYLYFVNSGEICVRIEPDHALLRSRITSIPAGSGTLED